MNEDRGRGVRALSPFKSQTEEGRFFFTTQEFHEFSSSIFFQPSSSSNKRSFFLLRARSYFSTPEFGYRELLLHWIFMNRIFLAPAEIFFLRFLVRRHERKRRVRERRRRRLETHVTENFADFGIFRLNFPPRSRSALCSRLIFPLPSTAGFSGGRYSGKCSQQLARKAQKADRHDVYLFIRPLNDQQSRVHFHYTSDLHIAKMLHCPRCSGPLDVYSGSRPASVHAHETPAAATVGGTTVGICTQLASCPAGSLCPHVEGKALNSSSTGGTLAYLRSSGGGIISTPAAASQQQTETQQQRQPLSASLENLGSSSFSTPASPCPSFRSISPDKESLLNGAAAVAAAAATPVPPASAAPEQPASLESVLLRQRNQVTVPSTLVLTQSHNQPRWCVGQARPQSEIFTSATAGSSHSTGTQINQ